MLIAAMVSTRATNKLKKTRKTQEEGEYISLDESETESEDWEKFCEEAETAALAAEASKGKAPASSRAKTPSTAAEKGKAPMSMKRKTVARRKGRARGIEIREPIAREQSPLEECFVHVSTDRMKDFEKHECIGERHVNVAALKDHSRVF